MKGHFLISCFFSLACCCCFSCRPAESGETKEVTSATWDDYDVGQIDFQVLSPDTRGAAIYKAIIPDPKAYITEQARKVLATLYFSPEDSIPDIECIHYKLREYDGISAKDGAPPAITIEYSTKWIEKSFGAGDTAKVDYEPRGVLSPELTHGFQVGH